MRRRRFAFATVHGWSQLGRRGRAPTPQDAQRQDRVIGALLDARAQPLPGLRLRGGAKSKNHTNHNQNHKAHRNGIKRVKT